MPSLSIMWRWYQELCQCIRVSYHQKEMFTFRLLAVCGLRMEWPRFGEEREKRSRMQKRKLWSSTERMRVSIDSSYQWMTSFRFSRCIIWLNQIDQGASEYWWGLRFNHLFGCSSKSVMSAFDSPIPRVVLTTAKLWGYWCPTDPLY